MKQDKKYRQILPVLALLCCGFPILAQQDGQYTMFMFQKMQYNPGATGHADAPILMVGGRQQWIGLEGAPASQLVSFSGPIINGKVGVGITLQRHSIGISENYSLEGSYAYRLRLGRGNLSLGLSSSVRLIQMDFSSLTGTQPVSGDNAIPAGLQSKYVPNFGAGIYFSNKYFFAGIGSPRLLRNNIDLAESSDIISREVEHIYGLLGFEIPINDNTIITPQLLTKYVQGSPFDADVNITFRFMDAVGIGASYRLGGSKSVSIGESVSAILSADIKDRLTLAIAYDMTLSALRKYNSGTFEGVLRYRFGDKTPDDPTFDNPRSFY